MLTAHPCQAGAQGRDGAARGRDHGVHVAKSMLLAEGHATVVEARRLGQEPSVEVEGAEEACRPVMVGCCRAKKSFWAGE